MQNKSHSRKFLQRRKFYTFLPLLVLPFLTLFFWSLIGKHQGSITDGSEQKGLILTLPDAILKDDKALNKLSYYQKAAADSARLRELIKKDPYYQDTLLAAENGPLGVPLQNLDGPVRKRKMLGKADHADSEGQPEEQVNRKLNELNKLLSQTSQPEFDPSTSEKSVRHQAETSPEIARLEQMMAGLQSDMPETETDPEMQELAGMLDKIMQIQNPELAQEKLREQSAANGKQVFPVVQSNEDANITLLEGQETRQSDSARTIQAKHAQTGFYSLENTKANSVNQTAIEAVVDQNQALVSGATIKLRLSSDVFISGKRISAGSFLFGKASLNQERLRVNIESVRSENSLFPVSLSVYDMDGLEGIYIPGAISRDVGKQSSDRAIQSLNIPIMDPSLGAQAASAGIEAAKTFIGRKAKLIQVTVKAGYRVLLKDANAKSI